MAGDVSDLRMYGRDVLERSAHGARPVGSAGRRFGAGLMPPFSTTEMMLSEPGGNLRAVNSGPAPR